jgi:hypothetical protein
VYESRALREWQFSTQDPSTDGKEPTVVWTDHSDKNEGQMVIPEAILLPTERALLENSPKVEDYVLDMKAPTKRRSKRRSKLPE